MNAITIRPLREDADTVTLSRADFEAMAEALEDAADIEDIRQARERILRGEEELLPFELVEQILDGMHPVKAFRQYRGFSQRALAKECDISPSYLSEIESGRKPGSVDAMVKLSKTLRVPLENLLPTERAE